MRAEVFSVVVGAGVSESVRDAAVSMSLSKPAVPRPKSRPLPSAVTGSSSAHQMRETVGNGPRSMPEARPLHARKAGYDINIHFFSLHAAYLTSTSSLTEGSHV